MYVYPPTPAHPKEVLLTPKSKFTNPKMMNHNWDIKKTIQILSESDSISEKIILAMEFFCWLIIGELTNPPPLLVAIHIFSDIAAWTKSFSVLTVLTLIDSVFSS